MINGSVSASLVMVHLIEKLAAGDTGSLSVSILQKMSTMSKKLKSHLAFSELLAQYSQSGYFRLMQPKKTRCLQLDQLLVEPLVSFHVFLKFSREILNKLIHAVEINTRDPSMCE
ncbi:uncharacterized protein LOC133803489 isoform X2 [Humulus lupulus]|uniref:uncharacterized protein LOC133803489 isoform X2 n=1 Tax=Humulus lupulus TaxID=3486 RepID=UPI002B410787|nr:uncharacterized protein LOC133803489 isoform X2 [Humulus lupulus]